mgnify:CR=1 FL=1
MSAALSGVMAGGEYWDTKNRGKYVEDAAHDTLAAERPADDDAALNAELVAALQQNVALLHKGIAAARDMLVAQEAIDNDDAIALLTDLLPKETP